mmetsp:Transcript_100529/g.284732  ORF Transcript_100529/g.284732 Transcript_100529/m.284732 type:complete len:312 (+) Transcript_100529:189-1124(+)
MPAFDELRPFGRLVQNVATKEQDGRSPAKSLELILESGRLSLLDRRPGVMLIYRRFGELKREHCNLLVGFRNPHIDNVQHQLILVQSSFGTIECLEGSDDAVRECADGIVQPGAIILALCHNAFGRVRKDQLRVFLHHASCKPVVVVKHIVRDHARLFAEPAPQRRRKQCLLKVHQAGAVLVMVQPANASDDTLSEGAFHSSQHNGVCRQHGLKLGHGRAHHPSNGRAQEAKTLEVLQLAGRQAHASPEVRSGLVEIVPVHFVQHPHQLGRVRRCREPSRQKVVAEQLHGSRICSEVACQARVSQRRLQIR